MGRTTKLTISLSKDLVQLADKIASEKKISRSQVISECLNEIAKKRKDELLKEGYLAMAEEHKKLAEMVLPAQREILPEWKV